MQLFACYASFVCASNKVPRDVVDHLEADLLHLEVLEAQAAHTRRHASADLPNVLPFASESVSAVDILRHAQQMAEGKTKEALEVFVKRASTATQRPAITPTVDELTLATWTFGNFTLFVQHALQSPNTSLPDRRALPQGGPPTSLTHETSLAHKAAGRREEDAGGDAGHKDAPFVQPVKAARASTNATNTTRDAEEERTHPISAHVVSHAKVVTAASTEHTASVATPHAGKSSWDVAPGPRQADASKTTGARPAVTRKTTELLQHSGETSTNLSAVYTAWTPNATATPVKSTLATFNFDDDDADDEKTHKSKQHSARSFLDKSLSLKVSKEGIQKHLASKQQHDTTTDFIANLYDSEGHLPEAYTAWQPTDDTPKTSPSIEAMKAALADDDASLLQMNHLRGTTNYRHQAASILLDAYASALHSEAMHELSKRFKHKVSAKLISHIKQIIAMQLSGHALSDDTLHVLQKASPVATKAWLLCQYFHTREAPRVTQQRRALITAHDAQVYCKEQIAAFARMRTKTMNLPAFNAEATTWRAKTLTWIDAQEAVAHKALQKAKVQFAQENAKAAPLRTYLDGIRTQCGQSDLQAKRERGLLELRGMSEALELIGAS